MNLVTLPEMTAGEPKNHGYDKIPAGRQGNFRDTTHGREERRLLEWRSAGHGWWMSDGHAGDDLIDSWLALNRDTTSLQYTDTFDDDGVREVFPHNSKIYKYGKPCLLLVSADGVKIFPVVNLDFCDRTISPSRDWKIGGSNPKPNDLLLHHLYVMRLFIYCNKTFQLSSCLTSYDVKILSKPIDRA